MRCINTTERALPRRDYSSQMTVLRFGIFHRPSFGKENIYLRVFSHRTGKTFFNQLIRARVFRKQSAIIRGVPFSGRRGENKKLLPNSCAQVITIIIAARHHWRVQNKFPAVRTQHIASSTDRMDWAPARWTITKVFEEFEELGSPIILRSEVFLSTFPTLPKVCEDQRTRTTNEEEDQASN